MSLDIGDSDKWQHMAEDRMKKLQNATKVDSLLLTPRGGTCQTAILSCDMQARSTQALPTK